MGAPTEETLEVLRQAQEWRDQRIKNLINMDVEGSVLPEQRIERAILVGLRLIEWSMDEHA